MKKIYLSAIICAFGFGLSLSQDKLKSKKEDLPPVLGGIVRSDKWEIQKNPPREEFTGNVSYKNPYYEVKADWALFKRMKGLFNAKGNVWGKKNWADGAVTEVFCHRADYNRTTGIAMMFPKENEFVEITHLEPDYGKWTGISREVLFDEENERVDLIRDVKITSEQNNALAGKISYYYQGDNFEFFKEPLIWGSHENYDFAVTGKSAKSQNFFDKVEVHEQVEGWIKNRQGALEDAVKMSKP